MACLAAAAFSTAQTPPASDATALQAFKLPSGSTIDIALVLPLETPAFARAADAVRAGFLAAADAAPDKLRTKVFAHGEDGVLGAFAAARDAGARVVVGPLARDDVKNVAELSLELPFTVALNQLDDAVIAPLHLYTFALSIDSDARQIARRMHADAARNVAVIGADTSLMQRFAGAFAAAWLAEGGSAPGVYEYAATPVALSKMRREIAKNRPDASLVALDGESATRAKPYLGTKPAYASGLVFERERQGDARDLDGLIVVEIPWIVTPNAPQFASLPKREFASAALTRLYALGLDAYRVAEAFRDGPPERFSLDGATGQVALVEGRQFAREGRFAVYRAGQLKPLDGPR